MTWTHWLLLVLLLFGASVDGVRADDEPLDEANSASDAPTTEEPAGESPAEEPFKVTLTDKWKVLVNPAKPRAGLVELTKKSPIQNVGEFTLTGPMVGHPFGLGEFAADGRWAMVDGVATPVDGKNALIHLTAADEFEMEGVITQEKFGGWLMLVGWNQGHGYSMSNVTLKESGSPWFLCEYRGSKAIEGTNNEVKHFEWKGNQPLRMLLKDKKLTVVVGKTSIVEEYPLENYTAGDVFLGTYDTRYGPKPIGVRSLRVRAVVDKPEKGAKTKSTDKKPEKANSKKATSSPDSGDDPES
ncbi:MAG: hypothetical protein U0929_20165 [Planctomycetaceae bacterium]